MSSLYNSTSCSNSVCTEHCNDYLHLLQELLEAEAVIENLQHEISLLREALDEAVVKEKTGMNR